MKALLLRRRAWTFLVLAVMLASAQDGAAQEVSIRGTATDAETGEPLRGVHVFLDQTTRGTTSSDQGTFEIAPVPPGQYRVVASMVGYATEVRDVEVVPEVRAYQIDYEMASSVVELVGIEVETDRPVAWERNLRLFERNFIGTSSNAELTEIRNPYAMDFRILDEVFTARAPVPIVIVNRALGYRLTVELVQYRGSAAMLQMAGRVRFEELEPSSPSEAERWKERRRATYEGSLMHFLRSLVDGSLRADGFVAEHELQFGYNIERVDLGAFPILEVTERPYLYRLFFDDEIVISYRGEVSRIRLTGDEAFIHSGGYVYGTGRAVPPVTVSGAMSIDRLADILPRDYGL
jgi:hypothetical protein